MHASANSFDTRIAAWAKRSPRQLVIWIALVISASFFICSVTIISFEASFDDAKNNAGARFQVAMERMEKAFDGYLENRRADEFKKERQELTQLQEERGQRFDAQSKLMTQAKLLEDYRQRLVKSVEALLPYLELRTISIDPNATASMQGQLKTFLYATELRDRLNDIGEIIPRLGEHRYNERSSNSVMESLTTDNDWKNVGRAAAKTAWTEEEGRADRRRWRIGVVSWVFIALAMGGLFSSLLLLLAPSAPPETPRESNA